MRAHDAEGGRLADGLRAHVVEVPGGGGGGSDAAGEGATPAAAARAPLRVGLIGLVESEWLATLATLDVSDVVYEDFVACARRLSAELRAQPHRVTYPEPRSYSDDEVVWQAVRDLVEQNRRDPAAAAARAAAARIPVAVPAAEEAVPGGAAAGSAAEGAGAAAAAVAVAVATAPPALGAGSGGAGGTRGECSGSSSSSSSSSDDEEEVEQASQDSNG